MFEATPYNLYQITFYIKGDLIKVIGGRFKHPWEVNQFGFNNTIITGGVSFCFQYSNLLKKPLRLLRGFFYL